ncbi:MAG TPA: metallophosphoesterase [Euryarchaeota archaeon]|nr:MAG: phosphoesterase [Thermococci archaeon]HDI10675.1 metallophosphoesterase [Euryarchaeota archaeon]
MSRKLARGMEIGLYSLFIEEIGALVVSDLHLGYEIYLGEIGVHVPLTQYKKIREYLEENIEEFDPQMLIVLGDLKHDFSKASWQEWREIKDFFDLFSGREVHLIRGNHDNYLKPIARKRGIELKDQITIGKYKFFHGHKPVELGKVNLMGHEHPAISIRDEMGVKWKFKCLLYGEFEKSDLIVLPSMSPLMGGTEVNVSGREDLLSPILRERGVDHMRVYVVDEEAGIYEFPRIGELKSELLDDAIH